MGKSIPELESIVEIDFVPFGNAYIKTDECKHKSYPAIRECWCTDSVNANASDAFSGPVIWQHGELEGTGNSIEACAIKHGGGNNAATFAFLTCFESEEHGGKTIALGPCAKSSGLNAKDIEGCFKDDTQRTAVVQAAARRTCALSPQHAFTPWVVLQHQHIDTPSTSAALTKVVCDAAHAAKITPLPSACGKVYAFHNESAPVISTACV